MDRITSIAKIDNRLKVVKSVDEGTKEYYICKDTARLSDGSTLRSYDIYIDPYTCVESFNVYPNRTDMEILIDLIHHGIGPFDFTSEIVNTLEDFIKC